MKYEYANLKEIFKLANDNFINSDKELFESKVSERTLCGALMLHLHEKLKNSEIYPGYHVDVEYNRNRGGRKTSKAKTIMKQSGDIKSITCDLIVHSRGQCVEKDNLIAIEMKKSTRSRKSKEKDRERLRCLTKSSFDGSWSFDGKSLPEHVCRYIIGIYYEIDYKNREIRIEYYHQGKIEKPEEIFF